MRFRIFIYGMLSAFLFSCQSKENKFEFERKIENDFKMTFQELGVKIRDTVFIDNDVLNISMIQDSGYFVDHATNQLLRSYFMYKYYDELKEMSAISIYVEYKHLTDRKTYSYAREGIDMIYTKLSDNPLFMSLVPYIAKNADANDIIYMDDLIVEVAPKVVPKEEYDYTGSGFWDFVHDYTKNCCNDDSIMHKNM